MGRAVGGASDGSASNSSTARLIKRLKSTGTIVNERARLASSEPMTDSDKGENRYFAVPCSKNTGTKTMQMHSVDKNVGIATSLAPPTID